jgi:formylglycine-generating enzyme required for sulfatase activity
VSWLDTFRKGLNRTAKFFAWEPSPLSQFRALVREQLALYRDRVAPPSSQPGTPTVQPRHIPPEPSELPDEPYPLLGPYEHPRTFAGRDAEIERLARLVRQPPLILCLHAPSGAGKSSLLLAGLAPRLRTDKYLVGVERAPGDPGLARRLITDVLTLDAASVPADDGARLTVRFAALVTEAHRLQGKPVVFILDQIDDVLRNPQKRQPALAAIGPLLAATAQRLPGDQGFACQWILCYRHEFHGEVRAWLEDALSEARALGRAGLGLLPSDLTDGQKSHDWAVPVFGRASSLDRDGHASQQAFLQAIVRPLEIAEGGRPRYPYVMSGERAERLAAVFAQFRRDRPDAPLVPELPVVLNDLLRRARERAGGGAEGPVTVDVPEGEALGLQIRHALRDHVERALNRALPQGRDDATAWQGRTRALLALRELVDASGRRTEGVPEHDLARMIGTDGAAVLAKLTAADMRLVIVDEQGRCGLSHDCLAEAVSEVLSSEAARRSLVVDQALIDLQRIVGQKADLYASDTADTSALVLTRGQREMVRANHEVLLGSEGGRTWWAASERAHARGRQRLGVGLALAAAALLIAGAFGYRVYVQTERDRFRAQLVETLSNRRTDFAALVRLTRVHDYAWTEIRNPLENTFINEINPDVFAGAPWTAAEFNPSDVLDVIERSYPLFVPSRQLFGAMSFALEEVWVRSTSAPDVQRRAASLSAAVRAAFIEYHKGRSAEFQAPPAHAEHDALNPWKAVPGGTFTMGESDVLGPNEGAPHLVEVSAFLIQQHEVTNEEYRRFNPRHLFPAGEERHPVANVSWYEAAGYAAWLGASLPTEAQWEYAARGTGSRSGRRYPWGNESPDQTRAVYESQSTAPVGSRPAGPTPEGLDDMAGNVWEWCRDAFGPYSPDDSHDPLGPTPRAQKGRESVVRVLRGGSFNHAEYSLRAASRLSYTPAVCRGDLIGFRLVSSRLRS